MKWIAATLMVVNVLIFLGVSNHQADSEQFRDEARPDVNRDSMLLLKEVVPDGEDGERTQNASVPGTGGPATVASGGTGGTGDTDVLSGDGSTTEYSCALIGPFVQDEHWDAASGWIEDQPWARTRIRSANRELRAVRIYLGPFESREAAQPTMDLLKKKELDHYYYVSEGKERISLGYFTQEELALRYVKKMKTEGFDAHSQPEYRTLGPFYWMDVRVERGLLDRLLERDWQAEGVRVTERTCDFPAGEA